MTESQVVNEWINEGKAKGRLEERRHNLLQIVEARFPGQLPGEMVRLIQQQDSPELLSDWIKAALRAFGIEHFIEVLKR